MTGTRQPEQHDPVVESDPADVSPARLEAFSDGVMAIAITLLALELKVDPGKDLNSELVHLLPAFAGYLITFMIVGVIWMNHHLMFSYIRRVDRVLLLLNLGLLLTVAVLPWPAELLATALSTHHGESTAAVLYGGDLVIGGVFFNAIWYYVSRGHRHLSDRITPERAAVIRRQFAVGPVLYLVVAVVGYFNAKVALGLYLVLIIVYMFEAGSSRSD